MEIYDGFRVNVLLDPSMLLGEKSFEVVMDVACQRHLREYAYRFYVAPKLVEVLNRMDPESEEIKFFADQAKAPNIGHVKDVLGILAKKQAVFSYDISDASLEKHAGFYGNLLRETGNGDVAGILFQEWVFIQENNVMISRIKKPFSYFIRAGAAAIEYNWNSQGQEKDYGPLIEGLKALGKWTAVAGKAIEELAKPIGENVPSSGVFLLAGSD